MIIVPENIHAGAEFALPEGLPREPAQPIFCLASPANEFGR
jgi:hypothetical protein